MLHVENYHFDPKEHLVNILGRVIANKQDVSITIPSGEWLAIFPTKADYYSLVHDMKAFCTSNIDEFDVSVLSELDTNDYRKDVEHGRNVDELLWQASYYASQGKLIKGCEREDVVEITYWPNLTRLPCPSSGIAITALLTRYPTSITLASHILKVPMEDMFEFYSAAHSAGFTKVHNRSLEAPEFKPNNNTTMLAQLLAKISRL